jgi:hypothetical protein
MLLPAVIHASSGKAQRRMSQADIKEMIEEAKVSVGSAHFELPEEANGKNGRSPCSGCSSRLDTIMRSITVVTTGCNNV